MISQGEMPLGVKEIRVPLKKKNNSKKAAFDLLEFEQKLYEDSNKVKFFKYTIKIELHLRKLSINVSIIITNLNYKFRR